jgi:hypothetical protein
MRDPGASGACLPPPEGRERGPLGAGPSRKARRLGAAASPFNWTRGAAGVFPAAAPASAQRFSICITPYALAWGHVSCFFAPRLPFLDFLDFFDFLAFLIFFFAAFLAFGCAAGAAVVVT